MEVSKLLCVDRSKSNRLFIPYENVEYLSLNFTRTGRTKSATVFLKNGDTVEGADAWFTTVEAFLGLDEEPQVTKKIGF